VEEMRRNMQRLTEAKKVIAEHAIQSLDMFFSQIENKNEVISFVEKYTNSTRKKLKIISVEFFKKWKVSSGNYKN